MLMKHTAGTCRLASVSAARGSVLCRLCSFTASARVAAWVCVGMRGRWLGHYFRKDVSGQRLVKAIKYSKTSWETPAVAMFILRTVSPSGGAGASVILASVATVQCNEKLVHC